MATSERNTVNYESSDDEYSLVEKPYPPMEKSVTMEDEENVNDGNQSVKTLSSHKLNFQRYFKKGRNATDMETNRSNLNDKENENVHSPSIIDEEIQVIWEKKINELVEDSREEMTRKEEENTIISEVMEKNLDKTMSNFIPPEEEMLPKENTETGTESKIIASETNMEIDCIQSNSQDVDEPNRKPTENTETDVINRIVEEDLRKKIEKNKLKSVDKKEEKIHKKKKFVKKPIVWDLNKNRIKINPWVIGVVAFTYPSNPFEGVKNFTLATFESYVIKEHCTKKWLQNLSDFIEKMRITHLYVQGFHQTRFLDSQLNVTVYQLPKRNPALKCLACFRKSCSIFKVKHFFKTFFNFEVPFVCYGSKSYKKRYFLNYY